MLVFISSIIMALAVALLIKDRLNPMWIWFNNWSEKDARTFQQWAYEIFLNWSLKKSFYIARLKNLAIIVGGITILLSGRIILAIFFCVFVYYAPKWIFNSYKEKQIDKVEEQLPDAINVMVSSVRAGRSLPQSIEDVIEKTENPIKMIFQTVNRENMVLGLSIYEALHRAKERVNIDNFSMLASALALGSEKGGDTLHILERISDSVRELTRLRKKIQIETTEVRSQQKVILGIAPVFFILSFLFDPSTPDLLFNTIYGNILLAIIVALFVGAYLIIKGILRTTI